MWRWRTFSLLALSRCFPISPSKKSIAQAFPSLTAYYGVPFNGLTRGGRQAGSRKATMRLAMKQTQNCLPAASGSCFRSDRLSGASHGSGVVGRNTEVAQAALPIAFYGVRDPVSLWLFCWVTRDHADRAINPTWISPQSFEQPRVNVLSRPVSPTSRSQYTRRESQMQQPTTSTTTNLYSLVDRVLQLRRQIGIDIPLSVSDPEDTFPSPIERELSIETPRL